MADVRPRWFLDIDGTLAPLDTASLADAVGPRHAFLYPGDVPSLLRVPYDPMLIARIAALHDSGRIEVVWLTTWDHSATTAWEEIGMPHLRHADRVRGPHHSWKANAVQRWLLDHPHQSVVWTDDDIRWRVPRGIGDRLLTIRPRSEVGLTSRHLDGIEEWLGQRNSS